MNTKKELYVKLIEDISCCHICEHMLTNPHSMMFEYLENDDHGLKTDKFYANLWNLWQGNLDADIMVIGQDFGQKEIAEEFYQKQRSGQYSCATDIRLHKLFNEIFDINLTDESNSLFFTNMANCYRKNKTTGEIHSGWLPGCANKYMSRLIKIITPKVIIVLGKAAFEAMYCLEDLSVKCENPIKTDKDTFSVIMNREYYLQGDGVNIRVFPVYHPGANSMRNRTAEQQLQDWVKIKNYYDKIIRL